jgi:hypothetical protein
VLPEAALLPVARFRKVAVSTRVYLHPDSIAARTMAVVEGRYLSFDPVADGMAQITAYLPADRAQALFNRITAIAKSLQGEGDTRTLPQLRADLTCDLLLDGHVDDPDQTNADQTSAGQADSDQKGATGNRKGPKWGIRPTVIVTVPLTTLIGTGEEPGNLDGYGPIDPATARRLAALAPTLRGC